MITRKKFYDVRRAFKNPELYSKTVEWICNKFDIGITTLYRIVKSRNFKEYKQSGNVYGKGVKSLRKRVLFILGVLVVVLLFINFIWI